MILNVPRWVLGDLLAGACFTRAFDFVRPELLWAISQGPQACSPPRDHLRGEAADDQTPFLAMTLIDQKAVQVIGVN